jgi:uncharacterized protein (TIGR02646 family)
VVFTDYGEALPHLTRRLGKYCSYCERRFPAGLGVEHVRPKSRHPRLRRAWDNLLLGCLNCNPTKGRRAIRLPHYYWPDRDNTFRAFRYLAGGVIVVDPDLTPLQQARARRTLRLTGLDRVQGGSRRPSPRDERWNDRRKAWNLAQHALAHLRRDRSPELRAQIVDTAEQNGHWSIWMTVFKADPDMMRCFIRRFPRTARDCFDYLGNPRRRPGGAL